MSMFHELMQDVRGLSGLPLVLVLVIVAFFVGEIVLSAQLFFTLVVSYALTILIRLVYFKHRPEKRKFTNVVGKVDASSFPSLHAMRASILATLFSLFFNNIFLSIMFFFLAVCVGYARVVQKRHYKIDVLAGFILGIFVAYFAVWFIGKV